jgi:hypothetical protein
MCECVCVYVRLCALMCVQPSAIKALRRSAAYSCLSLHAEPSMRRRVIASMHNAPLQTRTPRLCLQVHMCPVCACVWMAYRLPFRRCLSSCRWSIHNQAYRDRCVMIRVGQDHIYTVYKRYFWQGNHQIYGLIRCIFTILAYVSDDVTKNHRF